jgi:hemerythrin-like domain-containing protein
MKATELLKKQHREVKDLFKRIENAKDDDTKVELFEELGANLVSHDAIEREIFYPACEESMGMTDLLGEALTEHGTVEFCLYLADQAKGDDDFEYKCTVLKEVLEHHIEEEEKEFFPKVERALGKAMLEDLATQMEERFEEALQEDFREPLHANLKQVLAGALKPAAKRAPKKRASGKRPVRKSA